MIVPWLRIPASSKSIENHHRLIDLLDLFSNLLQLGKNRSCKNFSSIIHPNLFVTIKESKDFFSIINQALINFLFRTFFPYILQVDFLSDFVRNGSEHSFYSTLNINLLVNQFQIIFWHEFLSFEEWILVYYVDIISSNFKNVFVDIS